MFRRGDAALLVLEVEREVEEGGCEVERDLQDEEGREDCACVRVKVRQRSASSVQRSAEVSEANERACGDSPYSQPLEK